MEFVACAVDDLDEDNVREHFGVALSLSDKDTELPHAAEE